MTYHDAPWYIWAIWGPCAALLIWMVFANRIRVVQICPDRIRWGEVDTWREVALSDVARIEIITWSDGADTGAIVLHSGAEMRLTSGTVPQAERLLQALARHLTPVLRDRTPVRLD